ncbi:RNA polymerase sigma factor, sigma-70 family [Polymorphum gilvum SL003B-26A1]|uniref:RNA polymerase sigma factor, sigma-70 family n=2 Tax=Polymorphum TaxID=991903 RepID=F2J2F4_POLGS|nr:RNA polymerase sigma factor, sigma-70 family [Polymorphum gilvum SL003B-26A1]
MRLTRGNRDEAEDLLSSTLVKAVTHVARNETQIREPRAFLLFAMKNEYISRLRRRNSERQVRDFEADVYQDHVADLADTGPSQESVLWQQETLRKVETVIRALPPSYGTIFQMRFGEERSYRDIAVVLGISEPLARKRVQTLRQMLRRALDDSASDAAAGGRSRTDR